LHEEFTQTSTNGHEMENIPRITGEAGASHSLNAFVAKKQQCNAACDSSARMFCLPLQGRHGGALVVSSLVVSSLVVS
jgi:hypothetical protein